MWHSYFCEQRPNNEIILKVMSTGFLYKNEDVSSSRMMRHFSAFRPRGASVFHLQLTSPDKAALLGTWSGDMMLLWWQVCTLALTLTVTEICAAGTGGAACFTGGRMMQAEYSLSQSRATARRRTSSWRNAAADDDNKPEQRKRLFKNTTDLSDESQTLATCCLYD